MRCDRFHNTWTPERVEQLARLWAEGYSGSQIAEQLGGVSRNAVIGKVTRLNLPKRSQDANRATMAYKAPRPPRPAKAPRLRVAGSGVIFEESAPPPPLAFISQCAFDALPDTEPQPWEERTASQCSWPIGDGLSCCAPVHSFGWCKAHHAAGRKPAEASEKDLVRMLRRYA